jgi:mRNA interferase HigB
MGSILPGKAMVVFSYPVIKSFVEKYPDAADAMGNWYKMMKLIDFTDYQELKQMFISAEGVGNDRYVFDIKGNKYRIIAMIHFNVRTVYIRLSVPINNMTKLMRETFEVNLLNYAKGIKE